MFLRCVGGEMLVHAADLELVLQPQALVSSETCANSAPIVPQ